WGTSRRNRHARREGRLTKQHPDLTDRSVYCWPLADICFTLPMSLFTPRKRTFAFETSTNGQKRTFAATQREATWQPPRPHRQRQRRASPSRNEHRQSQRYPFDWFPVAADLYRCRSQSIQIPYDPRQFPIQQANQYSALRR